MELKWRRRPLAGRTGRDLFRTAFREERLATLLESPPPWGGRPRRRFSIVAGGARVRGGRPQAFTPELGNVLPFLRGLPGRLPAEDAPSPDLPFWGGWLGWLGYDIRHEIEKLPPSRPETLPFPVAFWYEPEAFVVADHDRDECFVASHDERRLDELERRLERSAPPAEDVVRATGPVHLYTTRPDFEKGVREILEHLRVGDIFQANLTLRFAVPARGEGFDLYERLTNLNPSPFASYWSTPWGEIVSCSPERLIEVFGRDINTRPIAGTRPRGRNEEEDRALGEDLRSCKKDRAEHVMLVDLERNDLGRVSEYGSVRVAELLTLESYSHVIHLVSYVVGRLREDKDFVDAIAAVSPGGTITGCPKVRCMEILAGIEPVGRSLFYGSLGYLDRRGHLDLNLLIRTLLVVPEPDPGRKTVVGHVGAGVVFDSDPTEEWLESIQKGFAQLAVLGVDPKDVAGG